MKYLGLDLGTKTLGLAISDATGTIANPYKVLKYTHCGASFSIIGIIISPF